MHHLAKFRADQSNSCRDMAVHHLRLLKLKILPAKPIPRANVRHHDKFHADW